MPAFVPGLDLSRRFYWEAVRPLLDASFPGLPHSAALLGPGSEVLGFDTALSTDHDWGARAFLFLREEDASQRQAITDLLCSQLPATFEAFPVDFAHPPLNGNIRAMSLPTQGPVRHRVIAITVRDFVRIQLGVDLEEPLRAVDWLTCSSSSLGELVAGEVFHDGVGELTAARDRFAWYPHDVWLYLLAAGWQRIGQEEHLMPRAGMVEDELGSAVIGSRLVRDVMRLGFLLERRYAPYPKWLGTAFARLSCGDELGPILWKAQQATTWREREDALCRAYEALARRQNALGICRAVPESVSGFFDRPFRVIHGAEIARMLAEQVADPEVKRLASQRLIGNVDQWSDSTDVGVLPRSNMLHVYE